MPIYNTPVSITLPTSGSTGSLNAINFYDPTNANGIDFTSASLGSIQFTNFNTSSDQGASATFTVSLPSNDTANTAGTPVLTLVASGSGSTQTALMGVGLGDNTNPLSTLDIRSNDTGSPASIILRTNNDGVIEPDEETGRLTFAIESGSWSHLSGSGANLISSGSTAAIFSRVKNAAASAYEGVYGNLIFQVNDADNRTAPLDILELGYGAAPSIPNQPGAALSGSLDLISLVPFINMKNGAGTPLAYIGTRNFPPFEQSVMQLYDGGTAEIVMSTYSDSYISTSYDLGIGTTSPTERLHVQGNLVVTGNITGSNISASNNIFVKNAIGNIPGGDYLDFNTGIQDQIAFYNNQTQSLALTTSSLSSSLNLFINVDEGPGDNIVLTYDSASGGIFFTSSNALIAPGTDPTLQEVTNQGTETTAAITASFFSASNGAVYGTLVGTPSTLLTASLLSASGDIQADSIISSDISASSFISGGNLYVAGNATFEELGTVNINSSTINIGSEFGDRVSILGEVFSDVRSPNYAITGSKILGLNDNHFKTIYVGITGSSMILAQSSSAAGLVVGDSGEKLQFNASEITITSPLEVTSDITSSVSSTISGSAFLYTGGVYTSRLYIDNTIVLDDVGGKLSIGANTRQNIFRGDGVSRFDTGISSSGEIWATASILETGSVPVHNGVEGEMRVAATAGTYWIYVWIGGSWKRTQLT